MHMHVHGQGLPVYSRELILVLVLVLVMNSCFSSLEMAVFRLDTSSRSDFDLLDGDYPIGDDQVLKATQPSTKRPSRCC